MHGSVFPVVFLFCFAYAQSRDCANDSTIIKDLLKNYDKYTLPKNGVDVEVEVWVQDISEISVLKNEVTMDIFVSQMWLDTSLNFQSMNPCKQNITLNNDYLDKIWLPKTGFINTKSVMVPATPTQNSFIQLYPNGTVWINYRFRITAGCGMQLKGFPFDTVPCQLLFESYNYNVEDVRIKWSPVGAAMMQTMTVHDYRLNGISTTRREDVYPAGRWNTLQLSFNFQRLSGWYVLHAYVPTAMAVIMSWLGFTFGPKALTARTILGISAMLIIVFLGSVVSRMTPLVGFARAIDVWIGICLALVFASLIELSVVTFLVGHKCCETDKGDDKSSKVDRISLLVFPAVFGLFNIIYWSVNLS